MKPIVKIGPYIIESFKIPIERRGLYRLLKNSIKIEESHSQLGLEMSLLERLLPFKEWSIYETELFEDVPIYVIMHKNNPIEIYLDYPDACIDIIKRLDEV